MKVHVLTAGVNPVKDLVTCVQKAGALVEGLYPHSWAVAEATISEEEKKLGCIVLDFGKGTTDIIYYSDNLVHKTDSINIGSENIDRDVSTIFQTPLFRAEELKKQYAYANFPILAKENSSILSKEAEIFNLSGKMINKTTVKKISHVAYARVLEVFELHMKQAIGKDKIEHNCAAGIIISGGGAKLIGINQMVETFFRVPVKTGVPTGVMNLDKNFQSPEFASLVGTLLLATKKSRSSENKGFIPQALERIGNVFKRWF
jgi:cell division protein FtsA